MTLMRKTAITGVLIVAAFALSGCSYNRFTTNTVARSAAARMARRCPIVIIVPPCSHCTSPLSPATPIVPSARDASPSTGRTTSATMATAKTTESAKAALN